MKKLSIVVVFACTAAAFSARAAHATFTCRGTVSDMTINDNVIVPSGANCRLVRDTVNVQQSGALIVLNTRITGNLQSIGARWIRIRQRQPHRRRDADHRHDRDAAELHGQLDLRGHRREAGRGLYGLAG